MEKSTKIDLVVLIFGFLIIISSIHFYIKERASYSSIAFIGIVTICLILIFISFLSNIIIKFLFGIDIKKMKMSTAQHYHTMLFNFIILFSGFIGIGLTLIGTSHGEIWRTYNFWFIGILFCYFVFVMFFVFFIQFRDRIKVLNKTRSGNK